MSSREIGCINCATGVRLRVLRCLHTFCEPCLRSQASGSIIKCGLCNFQTRASIEDLPVDSHAEAEMRRRQGLSSCRNCGERDAEVFCQNCSEMLCASCDAIVHRMPIFREHRRDEVRGLGCEGVVVGCKKHNLQSLSLYCVACKTVVCETCTQDSHRGHHIKSLASAETELNREPTAAMTALRSRAQVAGVGMLNVGQAASRVSDLEREALQAIDHVFDDLAVHLATRQRILRQRVSEAAAEISAQLESQLRALELTQIGAERSCGVCESLQSHRRDFFLATLLPMAAALPEYVNFIEAQPIEQQPCREPDINVSFSAQEVALLKTQIEMIGKLEIAQATERIFSFDHIGDRRGILYHLGTRCGTQLYENPAVAQQVLVSSSSVGYGQLSNLVSDGSAEFCTQNEHFSWICVELPFPTKIHCYTLCHDRFDAEAHFLRTWELQGWDVRAEKWETLSSHSNDRTLCARNLKGKWDVQKRDEEHKKFRIAITGPNSHGNHYLMASGIEFYGTLFK